MFYSKDALIEIGASTFGVRISASSSLDRMVAKLVETLQKNAGTSSSTGNQNSEGAANSNDTELNIAEEVIKAMLERSFMKPLKGNMREHCQLGHKLELPIARDWMTDLNEKSLFEKRKVVSFHKVGLVSKKGAPWAKDSIDFIYFILDEDDNDEDVELVGVEIKSRQSNVYINQERDLMRKLGRKKI